MTTESYLQIIIIVTYYIFAYFKYQISSGQEQALSAQLEAAIAQGRGPGRRLRRERRAAKVCERFAALKAEGRRRRDLVQVDTLDGALVLAQAWLHYQIFFACLTILISFILFHLETISVVHKVHFQACLT